MKRTLNDVKFILKDPSSESATLIYLIYRFNGLRLKYSTGEKAIPANWNLSEQRFFINQQDRVQRRNCKEANMQLDRYQAKVLELRRSFDLSGLEVTPELFKSHLNKEFKKRTPLEKVVKRRETLLEFAQRFIDESKSGERLVRRRNKRYMPVTLKTHQTTLTNLYEFQAFRNLQIDFDSIDLNFHQKFIKWLTNSKQYASNSIGNQIKHLKAWMRAAGAEGLHDNRIFESDEFNKPNEESVAIYLRNIDLDKIFELDLQKDKKLDRVRDLFLIGCYTGLRFSDFSQLRKENIIHNGQLLKIITSKTQSQVTIPINPRVSKIFEKYASAIPSPISNQKMNEYIKEIGNRAGLNEMTETAITKGGRRVISYVEKHKVISTHTARRSFATNAYLASVPTIDIMRITGHKTELAFMKYIKVSGEETAMRMLAHDHFK
ncbi:site-specific integrase [Dyadobacter aurulentus]|uniref:site-specific integrase n=1 Tax=Dyadobacter sp. UC 10 TaxID=2605428 RepID=UPI0011F0B6F2|nr:site-specific integrase [Dyadobacter sp. UC 10]KAA0990482.1 site-specific integrase [Dyadobacter sp. UC 10]